MMQIKLHIKIVHETRKSIVEKKIYEFKINGNLNVSDRYRHTVKNLNRLC